MSDSTKNFAIRAAVIVAAIAVIAYVAALYQGMAVIPESVQTQFWIIVMGLLIAGASTISARISNRNAQQTQDKVDEKVDEAVTEIKATITNGGGDVIAHKTVSALAPLILDGERRKHDEPNGERRRQSDS